MDTYVTYALINGQAVVKGYLLNWIGIPRESAYYTQSLDSYLRSGIKTKYEKNTSSAISSQQISGKNLRGKTIHEKVFKKPVARRRS